MDNERVQRIVLQVSSGDSDMQTLLSMVFALGREEIDRYPDTESGEYLVAKKMVMAASRLAGLKISYRELSTQGAEYWQSNQGRNNHESVVNYLGEISRRGAALR